MCAVVAGEWGEADCMKRGRGDGVDWVLSVKSYFLIKVVLSY